jgi:RNA polymerase sigma-70 factor (ECF subfamily)
MDNRSAAGGKLPGRSENEALQPTDQELVHRARRGDASAFHALVDRYARMMFGLAYSLLNNSADAEDVVQETFAGAYKGLGRFEERASVKTWLSRILVNQVARLRRDRGPLRPATLDESTHDDASRTRDGRHGGAAVAGVDARLDLAATLERLSPDHCQVLVLRELEHMTYDEMAAALDVPRGTVESRLHRARAELRKLLQGYMDE